MEKTLLDITETHKLYDAKVETWKLIDDMCDGENLRDHLVTLNPDDTSTANTTRNEQYYSRAVYYNFAGYTERGMIGLPFRKWPKLIAPELLEYVADDVDGSGTSIYQQSQAVVSDVVRKGRAGLWVDYPRMVDDEGVPTTASLADLNGGRVHPTIKRFSPEAIIMWETAKIGATSQLSRVVIEDTVVVDNEDKTIYLELVIEDGSYHAKRWEQSSENASYVVVEDSIILDASGNALDFIPFVFVGSQSNTPEIDYEPMRDIARIAKGHWNNSASYEDMVHYCGIVQPYMTGLDQSYIDMLRANKMYIGCGQLIGVPSGETFGFAQAAANSIVREAMKDKVELAVGMGAVFIQPGSAVKTATQSAGEQEVQHSVLSLIVSNVNEAYQYCLEWCAMFVGINADGIEYTITQDFVQPGVDAQMLQQMVAAWMQGAVPFPDLAKWLQARNLVDPEKTIEEIQDEVEKIPEMPNLDEAGGDEGNAFNNDEWK